MKKVKWILTAFAILILLIFIGNTSIAAGIDIDSSDISGIYDYGDETFASIGAKITGIVQYICYGVALIVLLYKGAQFMQKSPEGKAEAKKELISYAIGAFILFTIGTIVRVIGNIANTSLFK